MGKKKKNKHIRTKDYYMLTYERKTELKNELQKLKQFTRKEVAQKIREARMLGDLSNNKAYDDAKDEQRRMEARIQELEEVLNNAKMVEEEIILDSIVVGCKVKIHDLKYDEYMDCCIVNTAEANSLANKFSDQSPLGKALLGKKEGETVKVSTGFGSIQYRIIEIEGIDDKYIKNVRKKEKITVANNILKSETEMAEIRDISPKSFITRVTVYSCVNEKHKLIDIRCRVKVLKRNGKVEEQIVPSAYCETCDKYFMLENEFQRLRLKGILVCKVVEKDYWLSSSNQQGYMNLNKESLLHILGYNVNAQADLSKLQRWRLLEVIVDEGIMTVSEIQSHLQWLIKRSANNRNFEDARFKWEMDYNHISNYNSSKKPVVDVKDIRTVNYRKLK